jgi:hypothetical protein
LSSAIPLSTRLGRTAKLALLFGLGAALLYAKALPCVFARVCHLPCPGCGSTRAVLALLSGDVHGVLVNNPLGPVVATILGLFALQSLGSMFRHGDFREVGAGRLGRCLRYAAYVVGAAELALWGLRFFGLFGGPVAV